MIDVARAVELLRDAGVVGALVIALWAGVRGAVMPAVVHSAIVALWRERYDEMRSERDYYRDAARRATEFAEYLAGKAAWKED